MAHQLCAHLDAFTSVSQQEAGQFSVPHAEINSSNSLSLWGTACWRLNQEHQVKPVQIYKTTCYLKLSLFTFQEPWSPSFHGNGFKIIMGFAQKKKQPAETGRDWTYRYYVGEDFYSPKWYQHTCRGLIALLIPNDSTVIPPDFFMLTWLFLDKHSLIVEISIKTSN